MLPWSAEYRGRLDQTTYTSELLSAMFAAEGAPKAVVCRDRDDAVPSTHEAA